MPQRARWIGKEPRDIPTGIMMPANAIILMDQVTPAPTNWQDFTPSQDQSYIVGAGGSIAAETSGDPSSTITLSEDGAHTSAAWFRKSTKRRGSGDTNNNREDALIAAHTHVVSFKNNPDASNVKLIQATLETGVPTGGIVLTDDVMGGGMEHEDSLNDTGGVIRVDTAGTFGFEARGHIQASDEDLMDHKHRKRDNQTNGFGSDTDYVGEESSNFPHEHVLPIVGQTKRVILQAYKALSDLPSMAGIPIVLYPAGSVPTSWSLCDGSNGTPDSRDAAIECQANGSGSVVGSNAFSAPSQESTEFQHHHDNDNDNNVTTDPIPHDDLVSHTHQSVEWADTVLPKYYGLQFIKYTG